MVKIKSAMVILFYFCTALLFFSMGCTKKETQKNTLIIAASSNIQQPLTEIINLFKAEHDCEIEISIAASGTLVQQIIQGAPYDIFLSANLDHASYVHQKLPLITTKPAVYALGQLALYSHLSIPNFSLESLNTPLIQSIAAPLPALAPYGKAAIETTSPQLYNKIKDKIIYTDSTQQTLHYLATHQVQSAFIHQSSLLNPSFKNLLNQKHSLYLVPQTKHQAIEQSIIQIKHKNKETLLGEKFHQYILSKRAQNILIKYHYLEH